MFFCGTTCGIPRKSGAVSVGSIGDRRSLRRRRREEADVTLNSNNPTLKGGENDKATSL